MMTKKQLLQALEVYEDSDQVHVGFWDGKQTQIVPAAFCSSFVAGNPPALFAPGWDGPAEVDPTLKELADLRQWKESACKVIAEWEEAWEAAGKPGKLGQSKAAALKDYVVQKRQFRPSVN